MNLLLKLFINAVALIIAARLVDGIYLSEKFLDIVVVAVIFGIINLLIKPLLKFLTLPFIFLTLGLFTLIINALMLLLTDTLSDSLIVSGFWAAFWGSIIISIVSVVLNHLLDKDEKKKKRG